MRRLFAAVLVLSLHGCLSHSRSSDHPQQQISRRQALRMSDIDIDDQIAEQDRRRAALKARVSQEEDDRNGAISIDESIESRRIVDEPQPPTMQDRCIRKCAKDIEWSSPLRSTYVTSRYGRRYISIIGWHDHLGLDFEAKTGTRISAAADGIVIETKVDIGCGRSVKIEHAEGVRSRYCHMSSVWVRIGKKLKRGDVIGLSGRTGLVTGAHLHFEITEDVIDDDYQESTVALDPAKFINKE